MSLIQIERERPDLWKAEVEAVGPNGVRREMLHAPDYDTIMAKVDECYRRLTAPSEKGKRKALEVAVEAAVEPADAPNVPEAPEDVEAATGHQAATAAVLPSEVEHIGREVMGEAKARADAEPVRQKRKYTRRA